MNTRAFRVHHIGLLVANIDIQTSYFVRRFGYLVESDVIEDSAQSAFVTFLRQEGAQFWLELITPNGPTSKLGNALRKGGGLHHICYEVDDMDGAAQDLYEDGMMMVGSPAPATAFPGRNIAWFMGRHCGLIELLEAGQGQLSLHTIKASSAMSRTGDII